MKLSFLGAARTVTGSNYLLETGGKKILIDCGLWQGAWFADRENHEPFIFDPKEIETVLVTHAHADHIGRLPKLYREGFRGKIFCAEPTFELSRIILMDAVKVMRYEQEEFGSAPIFDENDVEEVLRSFEKVRYGEKLSLGENTEAILYDAGHILGSAFIKIFAEEKTIVFSGDLGNSPTPFLEKTAICPDADYLILESTYGNRIHEEVGKRKLLLERAIEDTITAHGVLMIPSFALERTQEVLYELNELVEHHRIPKIPIFLDSPLAAKATEIYKQYSHYFNQEAKSLIFRGDDIFQFPTLTVTATKEESKRINNVPSPKAIIACSGSGTGGRILHHEKRYLGDKNSMVLIIAWQIPGSLGRNLADGKKEVTIHGERIQVRAKIQAIWGYSAHADCLRLIDFIRPAKEGLKKIFLTHGEEDAQKALAKEIGKQYGIAVERPKFKQEYEL